MQSFITISYNFRTDSMVMSRSLKIPTMLPVFLASHTGRGSRTPTGHLHISHVPIPRQIDSFGGSFSLRTESWKAEKSYSYACIMYSKSGTDTRYRHLNSNEELISFSFRHITLAFDKG